MPQNLAAARLILIIVASSYPIAGALLLWAKHKGEDVPWLWPAVWFVTGAAGLVLSLMLSPSRTWPLWPAVLALGPIMLVSLLVDIRHGYWLIAAIDVAGLVAIAYAAFVGSSR